MKNKPSLKPIFSGFTLFVRQESFSGVLLVVAIVAALVWANSSYAASYDAVWESVATVAIGPYGITMTLREWINDALMAVFFLVVGLEIKREVLVGELSRPRQALFPVAAAVGGMLAPALIYLAFNPAGSEAAGWGIPMATDIALALGVLSLLGKRVPTSLKVFLTAVAIVDDIGAVLVIAIFYSHGLAWGAILVAAALVLLMVLLNRAGVDSTAPYAVLGIVLWVVVLHSGIHATVAGVLLAACIPSWQRIDGPQFVKRARKYLDDFAKASQGRILGNREQQDALHALDVATDHVTTPLQELEHGLHPWVVYGIMPIFALANAGVHLPADALTALASPVSLGVLVGLVLGKQLGIFGLPLLFSRMGWLRRPAGLSWRQIYGAAWLGGIGFTMSLFITHLAFGSGQHDTLAKVGILAASLLAGVGGSLVLWQASRKTR